jgi:hypothetical protein
MLNTHNSSQTVKLPMLKNNYSKLGKNTKTENEIEE